MGYARGNGGFCPTILRVSVKLRGARRAGSLRSRLRVARRSVRTEASCGSELRRGFNRADLGELRRPSQYAERRSRLRWFMILFFHPQDGRGRVKVAGTFV